MTCDEALRLLYDILDKEASEVDVDEVKEHLNGCSHCSEIYRIEGAVNEFIVAKLKSANNETHKLNMLKAKVASGLDNVDRQTSAEGPRRPFEWAAKTLVAAATILILIGAAFLARGFYNHSAQFEPLEEAHWQAVETINSYRDDVVTASAMALASNSYHYNLSKQVDDFVLVGGAMEEISGVEVAHFVFTGNERIVSVFVAPRSEMPIPKELEDSRVWRNQTEYFDHHCRGCRLVYHRSGDALVITATSDRDVELLDFVPGHGPL